MNKSITILGSYSGRNAGDMAILAAIMNEISILCPEYIFEIPTLNPEFIKRHYTQYKIRPIPVMPWNFSIRLLGLPVFNSVRRSRVTLITNGIIFDVKLFNPLFNFLPALACIVIFAKIFNKPVVCFNIGVGPVTKKLGKILVRFICNRISLIMVREEDSYKLLKELGVTTPIEMYADCAFNNPPCNPQEVANIFQKEGISRIKPLIGLNITTYVDMWIRGGRKEKKGRFKRNIVELIDCLIEELDTGIVLVSTQIMDIPIIMEIKEGCKNKNSVWLITNRDYTHYQIAGAMKELELFIGMRLHSLILASSVGTPVIGLVYAPKVKSFIELIGQKECAIDINTLGEQSVHQKIKDIWYRREMIKKAVQQMVGELRIKTHRGTLQLVEEFLK